MKRIGAPKGYRLATSVTVDPGGSWGARLARGDVVRFIDLEGQQAVDFLCYNASDTRDRYNAANTMKMAENVFLNTGTILYGEYATEPDAHHGIELPEPRHDRRLLQRGDELAALCEAHTQLPRQLYP